MKLSDILRQSKKIERTGLLTARNSSTSKITNTSPRPNLKIVNPGQITNRSNNQEAIKAFVRANRSNKESIDLSKTFSKLPDTVPRSSGSQISLLGKLKDGSIQIQSNQKRDKCVKKKPELQENQNLLNTKQMTLFHHPRFKRTDSIANEDQTFGNRNPTRAIILLVQFLQNKIRQNLNSVLDYCKHHTKAQNYRRALLKRIESEPFSSVESHVYDSVTDRREIESIVNEQSKIKLELISIRSVMEARLNGKQNRLARAIKVFDLLLIKKAYKKWQHKSRSQNLKMRGQILNRLLQFKQKSLQRQVLNKLIFYN